MRILSKALFCVLVSAFLGASTPIEPGNSVGFDGSVGYTEYSTVTQAGCNGHTTRYVRSQNQIYEGKASHLAKNGVTLGGGLGTINSRDVGYADRATDYGENSLDLYGLVRSLDPKTPSRRSLGGAFVRLGYQTDNVGIALGPLVAFGNSTNRLILPSATGHFGIKELFAFADFAPDLRSFETGLLSMGVGTSGERVKGTLGVGVVPDLSGNGLLSFRIGESFWISSGVSLLTNGVTGPQWIASGGLSYEFQKPPNPRSTSQRHFANSGLAPPPGWRFPTPKDRSDDWLAFAKPDEEPYHFEADFDGNGLKDNAWILLRNGDEGWGVWVFLSFEGGFHNRTLLTESKTRGAQLHGISLAGPGEYKTACGKGYWDCDRDESETLTLALPAIDFFKYESANSFFFWNQKKKSFDRVWMSD